MAISNSRLIVFDQPSVTFRYKNYRCSGAVRQQVMTIVANESSAASCCYASELLNAVPRARSRHSRRSVGRSPAAMPVLRRTHNCHRSVPTLASASRTAKYGGNEPGECAMTLHGSLNHMASSKQRRPTRWLAPRRRTIASSRAVELQNVPQRCLVRSVNNVVGPMGPINAPQAPHFPAALKYKPPQPKPYGLPVPA